MGSILADHLEVWGFENEFIIFADGSTGFALEARPTDISSFSDIDINAVAQKASQFLNALPAGTDIQFVQDIRGGGNGTVISQYENLKNGELGPVCSELLQARVKNLRDHDDRGFIPHHSLKIFVRRPASLTGLERPKFFSFTKKPFATLTQEVLERELQLSARLQTDVTQNLKALGITVRTVSADEIARLMYEQWNPARSVALEDYDPEDVRSSLLFTDVSISDRGFALADMHHRLVSLKILPDQTFSGMAAVLRELPFDSRLFLTIHVPDQTKELESLQTQRRVAYSMARGKRTGVSDLESEAKFQDLEMLLEQMIAQGEKVFRVNLNILLRSQDKAVLEDQVSQTLLTLRDLSGAEGMEESIASFSIFSELAIPNARAKERVKRMKTSNLCDLLPLYGPWRGFEKPSILLRARMGSLFSFDPFSPELTNANQLVSGGSGAGKSFLTNVLLLQMLKENPKVFFVDIGGSYKKLCENLSGQYLPLGVTSGISMNPFDLSTGDSRPSNQKIKFLVGLIELMTKEDGDERLPRLERAEIEEAIQKVYDSSQKPRLSDLRDILLAHPDTEIKRYGRILNSWCGSTPYGQFVDQDTNIELQRSIVAFDLKGMESHPDLQAVCLFLITDYVWRQIQSDRSQSKFLVFDECWKLLKNDSGLVFIEEVFRTFRKYNASAIAISQDIDDFAKSKIAGALLPNCSIKWVLMQNQSDPTRLKEALSLNDNEISLIQSLRQEKGVYSEAYLITQKQSSVVVIETTPLEYWIATSDPKDLAALETFAKTHPEKSAIETIKDLAKQYPAGVANQRRS